MADKKTINDQIKALEFVLNQLESGDATIEDSIKLYKEGKTILKSCNNMISEIEKELTVIDDYEKDINL